MTYDHAYNLANEVLALLSPHCERIQIAGSIRRKRPNPGDIEIVCIPKPYEVGLFESGIATVINKWEKVKGILPCRYTQRIYKGEKVDIFFAAPDNWGLILAIRTGSRDYSFKVLASGWAERGYKSEGGVLHRNGQPRHIREESDLFNLLGMDYVEPENREV